MLHQETNEYGVITIDNNYLNQLINESLKPYEGKVFKAHYKGGSQNFLIRLGNFDALSEIIASESEKGVYVKIYLMVKFGISMGTMANAVIQNIADAVTNDLGLTIDDIIVEITGMIMSKGIVKRNIVYRYGSDE